MLRKLMTTTAAAAIALAGVSATTLTLSADMAIAGNGNGNGNGNNNGRGNGNGHNNDKSNRGNGNRGNSGSNHGAIASALGALNAAHANENAFANASPNSRVGLIAAYRDAAILTNELSAAEAAALEELNNLPVPTRSIEEIQADIDLALLADPNADTTALDQEMADAVAYEEAETAYETAAAAAEEQADIEADALATAANKEVPTGEAVDELRNMLGL